MHKIILTTKIQQISDFGVSNDMATPRDQDFVGCGSDFFEPPELLGLTKITYIGIVNAYVRLEKFRCGPCESEASKSLQGFSCHQIGGEI
jgi:hypothetical protein